MTTELTDHAKTILRAIADEKQIEYQVGDSWKPTGIASVLAQL